MIHEEACLAICTTHEDSSVEHEFVYFIHLRHNCLLVFEEKHKFDEPNTIVANDLVSLPLLWPNLHFFGLKISQIWVLDSLVWFRDILHAFHFKEKRLTKCILPLLESAIKPCCTEM